jgi:hypothetical protein
MKQSFLCSSAALLAFSMLALPGCSSTPRYGSKDSAAIQKAETQSRIERLMGAIIQCQHDLEELETDAKATYSLRQRAVLAHLLGETRRSCYGENLIPHLEAYLTELKDEIKLHNQALMLDCFDRGIGSSNAEEESGQGSVGKQRLPGGKPSCRNGGGQ